MNTLRHAKSLRHDDDSSGYNNQWKPILTRDVIVLGSHAQFSYVIHRE